MRAAVVVAIAIAGTLRGAYLHFVVEEPQEPVDARFAKVLPLLPAQGPIGFQTTAPDRSTRYLQTIYALAPRQVLPDDGRFEFVVIDGEGEPRLLHRRPR